MYFAKHVEKRGSNMLIKIIELFTLLLLALICDIRTYKINNKIVYSFILLGILTNLYLNGVGGLKESLLGIIIPFALLFILYALRMLGAGDIKLFSAIGAIMGKNFILYTVAYSFIAGGIISFFIILLRKNGKKRLIYFLNYLKVSIFSFSLFPYENFENKKDGGKFRFSYGIVCGTLLHTYIVLF